MTTCNTSAAGISDSNSRPTVPPINVILTLTYDILWKIRRPKYSAKCGLRSGSGSVRKPHIWCTARYQNFVTGCAVNTDVTGTCCCYCLLEPPTDRRTGAMLSLAPTARGAATTSLTSGGCVSLWSAAPLPVKQQCFSSFRGRHFSVILKKPISGLQRL